MTAALAQMAGVGYRGLNFYTKEGAMLYCGLDLHAKESYLYVIDKKGHRIMSRSVPTQARFLKEWLSPLVRRKLMVGFNISIFVLKPPLCYSNVESDLLTPIRN